MHILLLTVSYKSSFNQHSAPFFRDQAIALKENGFRVGVICALPISFKSIFKNRLLSFKQESYVDEGIKTVVYPFPSFPKMPNRSKELDLKKEKYYSKIILIKMEHQMLYTYIPMQPENSPFG